MARSSRRAVVAAGALLLDADGVSKAAAKRTVATSFVLGAQRRRVPIFVSAVTLAEVLRGGPRDATVHILLGRCEVVQVTTEIGRAAGELLGRTGRKDTVDAVVVATAGTLPTPVVVLTSDPSDFGALTDGLVGVRVEPV